jgi:GNAT superfamily N-acetyltransferase
VSETLRISFEPQNEANAKDVIEGLVYHNIVQTKQEGWYPVRYYLRGDGDTIMGGLLGQIWGQWLHINILWVAHAARGKGHASEMLKRAEDYARTRNCIGAYLETFSFQARPLYEKHGYQVFATLDDYPPGHRQFFLKKALN